MGGRAAEKFNLPASRARREVLREASGSGRDPLRATRRHRFVPLRSCLRGTRSTVPWDLVVIDEAHKLRNVYRPSNKVGQGIRWPPLDCRKLLLTATPLQNSLLELYGLSTLIDEHIFGDVTRSARSTRMPARA